MKISVKPNRKKQIYCYFFTLPQTPRFYILEKHTFEQIKKWSFKINYEHLLNKYAECFLITIVSCELT